MQNKKSLSRELSLIVLGLISDKEQSSFNQKKIDVLFEAALELLITHLRDELDNCELDLENASQSILESELKGGVNSSIDEVRNEMKKALTRIESVMNSLSITLDFPRLIFSSSQSDIRKNVNNRILTVINNIEKIDNEIDEVMDGWRLKRLPRVDRDILRLAYADIKILNTPIPVACDEAVTLANKYSDTHGRKMINGVLRRLQKVKVK